MVKIYDDFLEDYDRFAAFAHGCDFTGTVNPYDGVFYPDICADVPSVVLEQIMEKLGPINPEIIFMRLTSESTDTAPHQAHTDTAMAPYTFLLYLQDGPGGTSMVRHKETGMEGDPLTEIEHAFWERDTNVPDAWEVRDMVDMKANRAVVFPSYMMHRAEPIGGFGKGTEDGRIALIMFFTPLKEKEDGKGTTSESG
jgi:hypothetical protein